MAAAENEYLTFVLAGEEYGVNILAVQEIRVWSGVTDMPNMPEYIKGVINLRGNIVPIIDLRLRLNKGCAHYGNNTVMVILKQTINGKNTSIGVVVDAVLDVCQITELQIKALPDFGSEIDPDFVMGMATFDQKNIILIDVVQLLDSNTLYQICDDNRQEAS